ncbi:peptidyl-prolyl cis-trans isomerase [Pseudoxanthomonas sacheonensis]|uniref:Periplasmic chaperone PpiD n=1 Tax=Pseudoxanthomonas sacheonensis TaxID=443615 RepID=A0ABU1RW07_9GAMM|nr:peptidyl-prolyl cis-trans isomerase [Pseudoxanthomonas sacheonensis]MDR6842284.1 peptidyl-prolyl cis-trans isomerase D [Pseudoxanthomonas sacheonensis]
MLQKLRDKTSGWIATAVLGLLIIPFAFVGVNEYMTGGTDDAVAKVEAPPTWWKSAPNWWPVSLLWQHEEVTLEEFRTRFEQARQQQRQTMGENFDPREFETAENKLLVLDQLIDQKVMQLNAKRSGIAVSNAAVRESIANEPAFQVDGKFDAARYTTLLSSQVPALTPVLFEQQERDRLQMALIPRGIGESEFVTGKEMDRLIKLLGETRDVTIVALKAPEAGADANAAAVSDAQIKAWYDAHPADYKQGESVTLEYVDVDGSAAPNAPAAPVDEAALRARYEQEKSRFMSAEQRLASHILISVPAGADAATQKAAEQKVAALAAQAKQPGADFAALAKANSQDPGSKDSGGDLGWVDRGVMVKPFEDALFAMKAGEISGPVKTDFGYHVLQLREIKPGQGKSFEEVRDVLVREQAEADGEKVYNDLAGRMVNEVLKNPTALGPAARSVGLPVQRIGPFSRATASGIAANPAVLRAAFSDSLVQDGTVSDPIEIGPKHSVFIRVLQHTPEQAQPLAQVRDAVIAAIRADRAAKAAEKAADAILARIAKGETLQAIAAADKLQTAELPGIPRGAPMPSPEINAAIFATQKPAAGKVSTGKAKMGDGNYAVFVVNKVTEGDLAKITPEQRTQLQQQVVQMDGASDVAAYVAALRKQYKITRKEDRL